MNHYSAASKQHKKYLKPLLFIAIALIIVAGGYFAWAKLMHRQNKVAQPQNSTTQTQPTEQKSKYTSAEGRYLFTGTVMLGRAVETYAKGDLNQPFSGMSTLGQFDAATAYFECPVTGNTVSYQTQVDKLIFNCKPDWLPTLKKYFPIVNLSSNHLNDQSLDGFNETVRRMKEAGLQVVGNFNPHTEKDDCKTVVLPVRLKNSDREEAGKLPFAFCSFNYKSLFSPASGELESIASWAKTMPVVALLNHGPEYQHTADGNTVDLAHKMIDLGAEFVVADGTHWIQNTEVYKGKLIEYSMGNFIFDQVDYDGRLHMALSVEVSVPYDANLAGWLKLGASCSVNSDDECLKTAQNDQLAKFKPNYRFDAIGTYGGAHQIATKANAQQQKDVETRTNWSQTLKELDQAP